MKTIKQIADEVGGCHASKGVRYKKSADREPDRRIREYNGKPTRRTSAPCGNNAEAIDGWRRSTGASNAVKKISRLEIWKKNY